MTTQELRIRKVDNGWIVDVGAGRCMTIVFESPNVILSEFVRWINDPRQVEKEYVRRYRKDPMMGSMGTMMGPMGSEVENMGATGPIFDEEMKKR